MRGIAALIVVLAHYKFFFYTDAGLPGFDDSIQPLYSVLAPFYDWGGRAVDLFFALSGFVFYWLYADKIAAGGVSAAKFSWLRFSRLYPLHIAALFGTVFLVAFLPLPAAFSSHNTPGRFFLHLFFASNWVGQQTGFNLPAWSVSVEILLYALFFAMCRAGLVRWWALCVPITAGWLLGYTYQGRGLYWFFLGGLLFGLWRWIEGKNFSRRVLTIALAAVWMVPPAYLYCRHLITSNESVSLLVRLIAAPYFGLVFFPLMILTAVIIERRFVSAKPFAALGNISYSAYLLHVPIIFAMLGIANLAGVERSVFESPWMLLALFSLVIPLSWLSFECFERPMQRMLRTKASQPAPQRDPAFPQTQSSASL